MAGIMNGQRIRIAASGVYLPERRLDNPGLIAKQGLSCSGSDVERIGGVKTRRIAHEGPLAAFAECVVRSLGDVHIMPPSLLIHMTTTPDSCSPAAAHRLHSRLGLPDTTLAMDVTSSCTSFLSALQLAGPWVTSHLAPALLVSAEAKSRHLPQGEMRLSGIFGDGAFAMKLEVPSAGDAESFFWLAPFVDGALTENIRVEPTVSGARLIMTEAKLMYRRTVRGFVEMIEKGLRLARSKNLLVRRVFVHQANAHLLKEVKRYFPGLYCPILISDVGNLVSASLPAHRARALVLEAVVRLYRDDVGREGMTQEELMEWLSTRRFLRDQSAASTLSVYRGPERILVHDGSGCINWLTDLSVSEWEDFLEGISQLEAFDRLHHISESGFCDLWIGAGGGFQALGVLHHTGKVELTGFSVFS